MNTVTTSLSSTYAKIQWIAPTANSSLILSYKVYIRDSSNSYVLETTACDESDATLLTN
jgi:hypothetical protein